jgi:predicted DNA-binding transcriptional regulator YafY
MAENLERQLAVMALLAGAKRGISRDDIFQRLENFYPAATAKQAVAAKKMFARDLESLATMGLPVLSVGEDGEDLYRLAGMGETLPDDFSLSVSEASGLRALLDDPVVSQQLASPSARVLSNLLAFHAPFDLEGQGENKEGSALDARLSRLMAMARDKSAAQVDYPSRTGAVETRVISPIGGWLHRGLPYVVAVCHRDQSPKTFSVAKIARLEAGAEAFREPSKDFKFEEHANRNAFRLENAIGLRKVQIRISAEESWRLKERAPWSVVENYPDGAVRAEFEVSSPRRFYRMILGYGRFAEILGPPEIRSEFAAFLKARL